MIIAIQLFFGLLGLYYGAEWLVKGSASLAKRFNISPLIIGLTVVGLGTSTPELIVSIQAALLGSGDIALGNVIGSNICNIGLIAGLSALISPIAIQSRMIRFESPILLAATGLLIYFFFAGNQEITRSSGLFFCGLLIAYTSWLISTAKKEADADLKEELRKETDQLFVQSLAFELILIVAGLAVLLFGGHLFLKGIFALGRLLHISESLLGLTVVSISTSLPELSTSLIAAFRRHGDLSIGNIVGSNIYNILAIVGITGTAAPIRFANIHWSDLAVLLFFTCLFVFMMRTQKMLSRLEGAILLICYISYMIYLVVSN